MMDGDLGSRSDLEALQRSGRGKVITLLVLLALALGAAGWFFFLRKQGTGNPEDPTKVLYVGRRAEFGGMLDSMGFDVAVGTFEAWELKAHDEVPDLEVDGIESIMAVADRFGYGYVIFEEPSEVDFSALDIEEVPELTTEQHFAVLSAGDFGFPHVMTINPSPSEVMKGRRIDLLQALFAQEHLAETLPGADTSSMDAIARRDQLRDAIERLEQVPEVEKKANKMLLELAHVLEEEERAEPKPRRLGEPLEVGRGYPLANGQVLIASRGHSLISLDGRHVEIERDPTQKWFAADPTAEPSERTDCGGGKFDAIGYDQSAEYWVGADGASLLTKSLSSGTELWTLDPKTAVNGCDFTKRGTVRRGAPGLGSPRPSANGKVAYVGMAGSQGVVSVTTAGDNDELVLGMLDDVELTDVAWLSERHLVAVGGGVADAGLYLFDIENPLTVLRLPSTMLENATEMGEVAVGRRGDSPVIVVSAGSFPTKVFRVDLPKPLPALFDAPPEAAPEPEVPIAPEIAAVLGEAGLDPDPLPSRQERGLPIVTELDSNVFPVASLSHEGQVNGLDVSIDGSWVAFLGRADQYDPAESYDPEVVAVPTAGGSPIVVTRNASNEYSVRLTADGSYVAFQTRAEVGDEWVIRAPLIAPVRARR